MDPSLVEPTGGNVQHDRDRQAPAGLDRGGDASGTGRTDQQDDVGASFCGEDDLVASPVRRHHLRDHAGLRDGSFDLFDRGDPGALDEWVADLDEPCTGAGCRLGDGQGLG